MIYLSLNYRHDPVNGLKDIRFFIVLLIFIASTLNSLAQNHKIDSLRVVLKSSTSTDSIFVDRINDLASAFIHIDSDSVIFHAKIAMKFSRKLGYNRGLATAYKSMGIVYIPKSRYDSAFLYFDSSFYYLRTFDDLLLESEIHNGVGIANEESGNFGESIDHYLQALQIKQQINDQSGIGKLHNNLGKVYYSIGAYDSATSHLSKSLSNVDYLRDYGQGGSSLLNLGTVRFALGDYDGARDIFKKALALKEKQKEPVPIATLNAWLGHVCLKNVVFDSALNYYRLSLNQFKDINHIKGVAALTARLAQAFMTQFNYDSALVYLEKGITGKKGIGDKQDVPGYMVSLAECYEKLGEPEKALQTALEASRLAAQINSKAESVLAFEYLHQLYSKRNDLTSAYEALISLLAYKDSVLNEQKIAEIKRLETIYGVNQLQQDKTQLELGKETQDLIYAAELRRQNTIQYSILGGLFLVILLALSYYRSFQRKQKANILLEEKNQLITIQKEDLSVQAEELRAINGKLEKLSNFKEGLTQMIAHDMKNPLHVIISLADGKLDKDKLKTIGQSGKEMLHLVTNMLDIQKFEETKMELKQVHVSLEKLFSEARLQTELLLVAKNIDLRFCLPKPLALFVDYQIIDRVIVNLMTNAIKYSPIDGKIAIIAQDGPNGHVNLSVSDEGEGIKADEIGQIFEKFWQSNAKKSGKTASTGLGLTFCKLAVEAHGGLIKAESECNGKNHGTTITLSLPEGKVIEDENSIPIADGGSSLLRNVQLDGLRDFHSQLTGLRVHQISQINTVLNSIQDRNDESKWKLQVKTAMFNGDQIKFDELIDLIE